VEGRRKFPPLKRTNDRSISDKFREWEQVTVQKGDLKDQASKNGSLWAGKESGFQEGVHYVVFMKGKDSEKKGRQESGRRGSIMELYTFEGTSRIRKLSL